jgi:hypothetical protein
MSPGMSHGIAHRVNGPLVALFIEINFRPESVSYILG